MRRSPKSGRNKPPVEHIERTFTTPTSAVPKPVKYTAYHIYQFEIAQIIELNWFLRGRLKFSELVAELGEKKAQLVQQKSEELTQLLEKAMPPETFLKQLALKGVF